MTCVIELQSARYSCVWADCCFSVVDWKLYWSGMLLRVLSLFTMLCILYSCLFLLILCFIFPA